MSGLSMFFLYGLIAIFTQNIVLTGGIGASRLLRAARKRQGFHIYCLLVFFFTLLGQLVCYPLKVFFSEPWAAMYLRPFLYAVAIGVLYLTTRLILIKFFRAFYEKTSGILIQSALNGVVFGVPLTTGKLSMSLFSSLGFAIGASLGFALAVWLVCEGINRIDNPDMPHAFRGIPASLLYLGLLSLAFAGLSDANMFI